MSNTYCIGDVHGCYYTLMALIEKIPPNAKLIFLGDLCDKGNYVKEVISFIKDNNHISIKGNHDYMMEKYLRDAIKGKENIWTSPTWGGSKTVNSYKDDLSLMEEHLSFISELPYFIEIERLNKYFLTHGFGLPYYNRRNEVIKQLMSNRFEREYPDWEDYSSYEVINIYGHCDYNEVNTGDNYFGIDTGCVYGRKLTAFELGTHKIIQENIHQEDIISLI